MVILYGWAVLSSPNGLETNDWSQALNSTTTMGRKMKVPLVPSKRGGGRKLHSKLTEKDEIKSLKGKMMKDLYEAMRKGAVLGISIFALLSTRRDGEEEIACNDLSMARATAVITDPVAAAGGHILH